MTSTAITIANLISRFRGRVTLTLVLVLAEAALSLQFPLFIGNAINGLLTESHTGVHLLAGLGAASLLVGSGRRFFDTRAYSAIYVTISAEMTAAEQARESSISKVSARISLLTEFVEFLENSMPIIVESVIGVFGILIIIFNLNRQVFWICVGLFGLMVVIYLLSSRQNYQLNEHYNNEFENQVAALSSKDMDIIRQHLKNVSSWNIKLSDLETWNYAGIWLGIIAVLVSTPIVVIDSGMVNYGRVFSTLMYVFQYTESLVLLPYFIQQIIRLREISTRLRK